MDKYGQITMLAEAALLIQQVLQVCDPNYADDLQDMAEQIANIADQIEGVAQ
jgi:hypothetical protein